MRRENIVPFEVVKCHDLHLLDKFKREVSVLPSWLCQKLKEDGLKLAMYEKEIKIDGLLVGSDGHCEKALGNRMPYKQSQYWTRENILYLVDYESTSLPYDDFHSTLLHEIGHAVDHLLADDIWWSYENKSMLKKPLDNYAAHSSWEQFAQAFESYFQTDNKKDDSWWELWHTKGEVYKSEPELFEFFNNKLMGELPL